MPEPFANRQIRPYHPDSPGWGQRIQRNINRLLLAAVLGVSGLMATGHLMQYRLYRQLLDLESHIGSSVRTVPNADGSVSVVLSPFDISKNLVQRTAPASVQVYAMRDGKSTNHGSGFFLRDASGRFYVVTNHHVIDGVLGDSTPTYRIRPYGESKTRLVARLVPNPRTEPIVLPDGTVIEPSPYLFSEIHDLALLQIEDPNFKPAHYIDISRLRDTDAEPVREGEPLFEVGNPGSETDALMPGIAHDHTPEFSPSDQVEFLGRCFPGSSGSPLFDMQGRVAGIGRAISVPTMGRCWAVSGGELLGLLRDWGLAAEEDD